MLALWRCTLLGRGPLLPWRGCSPLVLHVQGRAGRWGLRAQGLVHVMGPTTTQATARTALKIIGV